MSESILYEISIGSYFPDKQYLSQIVFPIGGKFANVTLELPEKIEGEKMDAADELLAQHMQENYPGQSYHIWYWWWLTP